MKHLSTDKPPEQLKSVSNRMALTRGSDDALRTGANDYFTRQMTGGINDVFQHMGLPLLGNYHDGQHASQADHQLKC